MKLTLADIRKNKNITQTEMAEILGISVAAYNLYENGERKIPSEIVEKIASILEINKDEFFIPKTFAVRKTNIEQSA